MITHAYKNGNITIKLENDDNVTTMPELFEALSWGIHAFDLYRIDEGPEYWGNDYAVWPFTAYTNGVLMQYVLTPGDMETLRAGRTARLVTEGRAPLFVMPTFYKYLDCTWHDAPGCMYWLDVTPNDDTRDALEAAGCVFLTSRAEYAPELVKPVVFVPAGVCFSFC
jgi:hypothetical protein